jgi:N-acetylglucosaminyldiphosphoundecaprenol N-acetyl-beta-D-mannosaminyltransferase
MPTNRTDFLDVGFDTLSMDQILSRLAATDCDSRFGYLVTPNVDHLVRLHKRRGEFPQLEQIYGRADFCICDSKVLSRLARLRGIDLPVTTGSDLTALVFEKVIRNDDRILIVGGDEWLLGALRKRFAGVRFQQHRPPMGLMHDAAARTAAARFIADHEARFTFICVGSPQQEFIAAEAATLKGSGGLAFCVGAALDFLTNTQRRAPRIARRLGLEWAYRLVSNPRGMWRRYLVEGPSIFVIAARWRPKAASG